MSQFEYIATTYFHQDWDLDAPTALALVAKFCDSEPLEDVRALHGELREILRTDPSDEELGATWKRACMQWDPKADGWATYRDWFAAMFETTDHK